MFNISSVFLPDFDPDAGDIPVSGTSAVDTDNDGIMDTLIYAQDDNISDTFEYIGEHLSPNDNSNTFALSDDVQTGPDLPNFDPSDNSIAAEDIIGEPAADMEHWQVQTYDDTCAINAQMFALEELTGHDFNEDNLREYAMQHGWYSDGGGTPIACMGNLLEAYGLNVVKNDSGTFDDIISCLKKGGKVVVAVDGDEIYYEGHDSSIFAPGDPNHAVEVIGVDYSNPGEPMVILNDSGTSEGCGEMVPLNRFMDAWQDSGCSMVEAYASY